MKKIISIILVAMMLLSVFIIPTTASAVATQLKIEVEGVPATIDKSDGSFTMKIKFTENVGYAYGSFHVKYDDTLLELDRDKVVYNDTIAPANTPGGVAGNYTAAFGKMGGDYWFDGIGEAITIPFKILAAGETEITIDEIKVRDNWSELVDVNDGVKTIKKSVTITDNGTPQSTTVPSAQTIVNVKVGAKNIYVNGSTKVSVELTNASGETTFVSNNTKVATVDATGKVTAKKTGKVVITATNNGVSSSVVINIAKRANTIKAKAKKLTVKAKSKKTVFKYKNAMTVTKAKGSLSFKKTSGDKRISVNKKTGKITIKKGLKKGKTYTFKVKVTAKGNTTYKAKSVTVKLKFKVK
jgi:hypothetical protein